MTKEPKQPPWTNVDVWFTEALDLKAEGDTRAGKHGVSCPKCYLPIAFSTPVNGNCQCGEAASHEDVLTALGLEKLLKYAEETSISNVG